MKRIMILAAGAGLIALAACNRADETANDSALNNDMALNETNEANAAALAPASASEFVNQAAASDLYEIEAGKLAADKASDAAIKSFGQMLATDHTKSSAELKTAAARAGPAITPPTTLAADKQAKIDALKAASGAEFDRLFIDQQIEAHSQALDLLNSYAAGGDSQPLKDFAAKTGPVIQAHLDRARSLKK
jgi:putative membrane protein